MSAIREKLKMQYGVLSRYLYRFSLFLVLLFISKMGYTCVSVGGLPKVEWIYDNTNFLFFGEVMEVQSGNPHGILTVEFKVIENFRGAPGKDITVYSINGGDHSNPNGDTLSRSCGCSFALGSKHLMIVRASENNDKHVPIGAPFKRRCTKTTEITGVEYPNANNNLVLWYFKEREKGLSPKYKPVNELAKLLKPGFLLEKRNLEFSELFGYK